MSGKYWDRAWSLVDGCTPVSAGCDNCWAAGMSHRFRPGDLTDPCGDWVGEIDCRFDRLSIPARTRKPTVFSIWNDLFHENVPDEFIFKAIDEMEGNERHTFLVLTKRTERMAEFLRGDQTLLDHIWWGTSAENQDALDERLPHLLRVPGKRFLSMEPLLGPIDLSKITVVDKGTDGLGDWDTVGWPLQVNWGVVGAETGPHKRECKPEWINMVVEQFQAANKPIWVKSAPPGSRVTREKGW